MAKINLYADTKQAQKVFRQIADGMKKLTLSQKLRRYAGRKLNLLSRKVGGVDG